MKYFLCVIVCLVTMMSDTMPMQAQNSNYVLVFHDEFNQKNGTQPDSTKWVRCVRYTSAWNRWISNSKDVVYIKNGKLICKAIPNKTEPNDTASMLTGAIETRGKYDFQYGKVEVRMKTNTARGNFPAFWMKPSKQDPNSYGEIDVMESFGDQGVAHQTIHNHLTNTLKRGRPFSARTKLRLNKWHVYGLEWTPDKLVFSIDGKVTKVFLKSTDSQELADGQWTFDRPFYLLLNQSVGDAAINKWLTPDTTRIYVTQFDWVRVYQKVPKSLNQ